MLRGGPGRDHLVAVDADSDLVDCGSGHDTATVDRRDRVRNCERIASSHRLTHQRVPSSRRGT
jgi:hypothetical protein